MDYINDFVLSIDNPNTAKVARYVLRDFSMDIINYSLDEVYGWILSLKPNSSKRITTICYMLGVFADWLNERNIANAENFRQLILEIDKAKLWEDAKVDAEEIFITYTSYLETLSDIDLHEEYNSKYFHCLFRSIYEGLYCDDMSVLKNLRSSDINGDTVTLHDDNGKEYRIRISSELSAMLKELSTIDIWERTNRYGICRVQMIEPHPDSVFKAEKRTTTSKKSTRFTYYSKLRKINDKYIEHSLSPLHLYLSGVIHRIQYLFQKYNVSLAEAFSENNRNRTAHLIVSSELERCNGVIEICNFRDLIKGHIDYFVGDLIEDFDEDFFTPINVSEQTEEYLEGEEQLAMHLSHERNISIVALAKTRFKEEHSGRLFCEACGFDFCEKYGERGIDFIEVHHKKFISVRTKNEPTKVEDLAMLCSNCHSILHRYQPWLSMEELEQLLAQ